MSGVKLFGILSSKADPQPQDAILPTEILLEIFQYLDTQNLKNARLACRGFNYSAAEYLFRVIDVSPVNRSLNRFRHIYQNPGFARHVEEIVWHDVHLHQEFVDREIWDNFYQPHVKEDTGWRRPFKIGWRVFRGAMQECIDPCFLARVAKRALTEGEEEDEKSRKVYQIYYELIEEEQQIRSSGVCLEYLSQALRALPKLRKITITDEFPGRSLPLRSLFQDVEGVSKDDIEDIFSRDGLRFESSWLSIPEPFNLYDSTLVDYHGFRTVIRALSSVDNSVRSLQICSNPWLSKSAGISPWVFGGNAPTTEALTKVISSLQELSLEMSTHYWPGAAGPTSKVVLPSMLNQAKSLRSFSIDCNRKKRGRGLDLRISYDVFPACNATIWPQLHTLRLSFVSCRFDQLLSLILHHRSTLRHLALLSVAVIQSPGLPAFLPRLREADLKLASLKLRFTDDVDYETYLGPYNQKTWPTLEAYRVSFERMVLSYLLKETDDLHFLAVEDIPNEQATT